jgi:diacylglycerol kinase family enzyme
VERAARILEQNGGQVIVAPTTGPRTAGAIARKYIQGGADLILAAGGDGTINEVAEGMLYSQVPMGILPAGTANVLAMELKMGSDMERVARRLGQYRPHRISVGRVVVNGGRVTRHFLLMAGIGLDAHIVYHIDAGLKARVGKLAYWVAGWSMLGQRLGQIHVELDGVPSQCSFALLSKVRNYGGDFEIAPTVRLFDDEFEAVLFEGRSSLPYVKYFIGMMLRRLKGMAGVTLARAEHIKLTCSEDRRVYVQIDGEFAGRLPAEITIVRDGLTLLVPETYAQH